MRILLLITAIIFLILTGCRVKKQNKPVARNPALEKFLGSKFNMTGYRDTFGNITDLNIKKTPLTIIDIWFADCPSCITEMKQFGKLLRGKEQQISIISISINSINAWKKMMPEHPDRFSFLKENVFNWEHLIFTSTDRFPGNNALSPDRMQELEAKWNTHTFPVYFVLNSDSIIQAVPESAVDYLKAM